MILSEKFTLLELCDLALKVPEIGAVNFNILHSVLTALIAEVGLGGLKAPCHIEDETLAQAAITKGRIEGGERGRRGSHVGTVREMKDRIRTLEGTGSEEASETARMVARMTEERPSDAEERRDETTKGEEETTSVDVDEEKRVGDENVDDGGVTTSDEVEVLREVLENVLEEIRDSEVSEEVAETSASIGELRESAREILEQGGELLAESAVVVTDALKILKDEELLDSDPARVMEEMWRATNVNRRMGAAEAGLRELSMIVDAMLDNLQDIEERSEDMIRRTKEMFDRISGFLDQVKSLEETCRTLAVRIEDANEQRASEVERLEDILKDMRKDHEETRSALETLEGEHRDLLETVAYKEEVAELKQEMAGALEAEIRATKKLLREVEDTLVKKEDFAEATTRLEVMEEDKVSRDELGRLLEPGFIDAFLAEQANLRAELEQLKEQVSGLETSLEALEKRIEEEVIRTMEDNFAKVDARLDAIETKLALLDPDEINDSFANLEEQAEMILAELQALKAACEAFQKEARLNFNKISNVNDLLNRLEQTKADKSKMYQLLETKADLELIANKLDRDEFASVVGDITERLERLTVTVKINEEEAVAAFTRMRHDLALKMYTEDFITATEPIRNRIRATLRELAAVRRIALFQLFPDAPGVIKCFSCNRAARLSGPKYSGDAEVDLLGEVRPISASSMNLDSESFREVPSLKFPPIDLDSVPIPPADHPREQDPGRLPLLFAEARPQVGLAHGRSQKDIDDRLSAYFAMPPNRREELLLRGQDGGVYRGAACRTEPIRPRPRKSGTQEPMSVLSLRVDEDQIRNLRKTRN